MFERQYLRMSALSIFHPLEVAGRGRQAGRQAAGRQAGRQADILLTGRKVITNLFVIVMKVIVC